MKKLICPMLIMALAVTCAVGGEPLPDLRDLDLKGWDCLQHPNGTNPEEEHILRNHMKNRDWVAPSGEIPTWDYDMFVAQTGNYDKELKIDSRTNITAKQAARLAQIEGQIVSLTGWVVLTYPGPKESCNCESKEYHDWHVELLPAPLDHPPAVGDPTGVICEITPRTEGPIQRSGVRLRNVAAYMRLGEPPNTHALPTGSKAQHVRITGYLLWDDGHKKAGGDIGEDIEEERSEAYGSPWRATAWEIHPILKIETLPAIPPS